MSKTLDLIPINAHVKPRSLYWEQQHILTGFWYPETPEYHPDEKLQAFLDSEDKPILLALGVMPFEDKAETEKQGIFVKAFEKCKMVMHHCGFGTTSASLIYGIPSIPVPHVLDQKGFANILFDLGMASEPPDENRLREQDVINRIRNMGSRYEERMNVVRNLSLKIRKERGLQMQ